MDDRIMFYDIEHDIKVMLSDLQRYYEEDHPDYESFSEYLSAVYDATIRHQNDCLTWREGAAYTDGYELYTEDEITEEDLEERHIWRIKA